MESGMYAQFRRTVHISVSWLHKTRNYGSTDGLR